MVKAGGLVGYGIRNIIVNCYSSGSIVAESTSSGNAVYAGGFIGMNGEESIISSCHSVGNITANAPNGNAYAGGFTGYNSTGTISNSYSAGDAAAVSYVNNRSSGFVGTASTNDTIINCYRSDAQTLAITCYGETASTPNNKLAAPVPTTSLQSEEWIKQNVWTAEWRIWNYSNGNYPTINYSYINSNPTIEISTKEELVKQSGYGLTLDYQLTANINLIGIEWKPITNVGSFEGNGYVISNYTVTAPQYGYIGLFRYNSGTIKTLGIENYIVVVSDITKCYAGGLVGYNNGKIENCYATGDLTVAAYYSHAGGLVGSNYSVITNCYAAGSIKLTSNAIGYSDCVGGLIGYNYSEFNQSEAVANCYAAGNITVSSKYNCAIGGLIGLSYLNRGVDNCYRYEGQIFKVAYDGTTVDASENSIGGTVTASQLNSAAFYTSKLKWSEAIWDLSDLNAANEKHPTLKNNTVMRTERR